MLYVSDTEDAEIRIIERYLNATHSHDEETSTLERIGIQHYEGYLSVDSTNQSLNLVWLTENRMMEIKINESEDDELILKIAQNMKYIPEK